MKKDPHICVRAGLTVGALPFCLTYRYGGQESVLNFAWQKSEEETLDPKELSAVFADSRMGFPVPGEIESLALQITEVSLSYNFTGGNFSYRIRAAHYGSLCLSTRRTGAKTAFLFGLELSAKFFFHALPALGSAMSSSDFIGLERFYVQVNPDHGVQVGAKLRLSLSANELEISVGSLVWEEESKAAAVVAADAERESVRWVEIRKDIGPLRLSRLGFCMGDGCAVVFVDAGVRLSVLCLEFMGLSLAFPFRAGKKPDFGLRGVAVTVSKPPLVISGGLYISDAGKGQIYTGEVTVKYKKLGLTALCSYGDLGGGKPSLFAFFLLEGSIGGPPVFFVTAVAGGFGYNRRICLPDRAQDVKDFPFVAAAMGEGELRASMTPGEVLARMDRTIPVQDNQYFVSAGIRFTSVGIVESFALLNVEFGEVFRISLLGISRLSLPVGAKEPMLFLELALRLVFAPEEGIACVEGALSDRSYLLHRDCKLSGGFACCLWFGNHPHAGDFVVTLGGYPKGFYVPHYPKADRVALLWKISDHLKLSAEFYFALVPSGVMMGGRLEITFAWRRLRAWLRVWAEFFMRWKPFLYEIRAGVSVGASFRWDFFPFYRTFQVELGANLELWGPPFGGRAHISWWVISFTISFGRGRPAEEPVDWNEFADTFLREQKRENCLRDGGPRRLIQIRAVRGAVRERGNSVWMDSDHMRIEAVTQMMCTGVRFGEKEIASKSGIGIVPMKIRALSSILTARLSSDEGRAAPRICVEPLYRNVPRALWADRDPSAHETEGIIEEVPCGVAVTCEPKAPEGILPGRGAYDMKILCRNERLQAHSFAYPHPGVITPVKYPQSEPLRQIETSIGRVGGERQTLLRDAARLCGVWEEQELLLSGWTKGLDEMLYALPAIRTAGAEVRPDESRKTQEEKGGRTVCERAWATAKNRPEKSGWRAVQSRL